jgi:hypothetical protein
MSYLDLLVKDVKNELAKIAPPRLPTDVDLLYKRPGVCWACFNRVKSYKIIVCISCANFVLVCFDCAPVKHGDVFHLHNRHLHDEIF